jgi:peptidyl-prolyl cis-trans isomerase D
MLNLFRKHATSWAIKVALFLIVIVFIFWGGYSYNTSSELQVAQIGDVYITTAEHERAYDQMVEMYRRQLGNAFSEDMIRQFNLRQQALDMLINRYVVAKAARELGLSATPEEIQQKILEYPVFQTDGVFNHKNYVLILQQNRLTPETFEQQVADDVTTTKLEEFIKRRTVVTEEEILADFRFNHESIQLAYVPFEPRNFEDQVAVDDGSLQSYYQSHQDKYKDPEKRQISYVLLKTDDFLDKIQVTEDEIRQSYEENKEKYQRDAEVKARHILFSVKEDAPPEEVEKVKAEARKVLDQAKKGADFAELAKKHSKDPGSAANGGDLGFFAADRMEPAFSEKAFSLKPGEISDLVQTPYGFHIIKVEETRPERTSPLEEVRGEIELSLKRERAQDLAFAKAREFADQAFAQKDIAKAAQAQNLTLAGSEAWVGQRDQLPGIERTPPDFMNKIFTLSEKEFSSIVDVPNGYVVAQVLAVKPSQVLAFDEVKERVTRDFKRDQARVLAQKSGAELLEAAKKANSLQEAAKEKSLEVKTSEWFSRKEPDKNIRLSGEAQNKAFELDQSEPFPDAPLEVGPRFLVSQLLGKKTPEEDLQSERAEIAKRIEDQKQASLWRSWLEQERKKADVKQFKTF